MVGLRDVRDPEETLVESDGLSLTPGRHRQLHVIETNNPHGNIVPRRATRPYRRLGDVP